MIKIIGYYWDKGFFLELSSRSKKQWLQNANYIWSDSKYSRWICAEELPSCSLLLHLETLEWADEDKRCCEIGILFALSEQNNVSFMIQTQGSAEYGCVIAPLNRWHISKANLSFAKKNTLKIFMTICACIFPLFCVLFHLAELEKLRPVPNYSFPCIFSCSRPGLTHKSGPRHYLHTWEPS